MALKSTSKRVQHARHRDERGAPLALHSSNDLSRIRGMLENDGRAKQRRHKQRHELSKDVAQRHKRDEA